MTEPLDIGNMLGGPDAAPGENDIVFTQYLRPRGRPVRVWITRPVEVVARAQALRAKGYYFEIEELRDHTVSMTVEHRGEDQPVAIEHCPNGPDVPETVDRLITIAFSRVVPNQDS
jgi:hypothetical protein